MSVRGTLHVYACPPALSPHVEWALAHELGAPVALTWKPQQLALGMLRCEGEYRGRVGAASRLARVLKDWALLRFEVTEEASPGCDGERYSFTPALGLYHATTSANGDIVVREDQLRALVGASGDMHEMVDGLAGLLGTAWDLELEPYRRAGEPDATSRLTRVV